MMLWFGDFRTTITDLYYFISGQIEFNEAGRRTTRHCPANSEMNNLITPGIVFTRRITSMIDQTLVKDLKND